MITKERIFEILQQELYTSSSGNNESVEILGIEDATRILFEEIQKENSNVAAREF